MADINLFVTLLFVKTNETKRDFPIEPIDNGFFVLYICF